MHCLASVIYKKRTVRIASNGPHNKTINTQILESEAYTYRVDSTNLIAVGELTLLSIEQVVCIQVNLNAIGRFVTHLQADGKAVLYLVA